MGGRDGRRAAGGGRRQVNPTQKALLDKSYGNCKVGSPEEAAIKKMYGELGLEALYRKYEEDSYNKVKKQTRFKQNETGLFHPSRLAQAERVLLRARPGGRYIYTYIYIYIYRYIYIYIE